MDAQNPEIQENGSFLHFFSRIISNNKMIILLTLVTLMFLLINHSIDEFEKMEDISKSFNVSEKVMSLFQKIPYLQTMTNKFLNFLNQTHSINSYTAFLFTFIITLIFLLRFCS